MWNSGFQDHFGGCHVKPMGTQRDEACGVEKFWTLMFVIFGRDKWFAKTVQLVLGSSVFS